MGGCCVIFGSIPLASRTYERYVAGPFSSAIDTTCCKNIQAGKLHRILRQMSASALPNEEFYMTPKLFTYAKAVCLMKDTSMPVEVVLSQVKCMSIL